MYLINWQLSETSHSILDFPVVSQNELCFAVFVFFSHKSRLRTESKHWHRPLCVSGDRLQHAEVTELSVCV